MDALKCGARHPDWEDRHYRLACDQPEGHPVPLLLEADGEELDCDHAYVAGGAYWTGEYQDVVYQLAENDHRRGLFRTVEGAKARAQEIFDSYRALLDDEIRELQENPDEAMLMERFTILPGERLSWADEQHYLGGTRGRPDKRAPLGNPVPTARYTEKSYFTIHRKQVGP